MSHHGMTTFLGSLLRQLRGANGRRVLNTFRGRYSPVINLLLRVLNINIQFVVITICSFRCFLANFYASTKNIVWNS